MEKSLRMARKWGIKKMENEERLEIFKQQMTLWGKVINALDDVFGEDSLVEVADDPYNYLQFTIEQGKKRVTIKKSL